MLEATWKEDVQDEELFRYRRPGDTDMTQQHDCRWREKVCGKVNHPPGRSRLVAMMKVPMKRTGWWWFLAICNF